jgi:hypothetical protein
MLKDVDISKEYERLKNSKKKLGKERGWIKMQIMSDIFVIL